MTVETENRIVQDGARSSHKRKSCLGCARKAGYGAVMHRQDGDEQGGWSQGCVCRAGREWVARPGDDSEKTGVNSSCSELEGI